MTVPSLLQLFFAFLRLGAVSFGGPAMIAHIERLSVLERRWLSGEDFRQGIALCQVLPGATAMQSAAYVGLRVRGRSGALAAYAGFGLPAFLVMLALSIVYIKLNGGSAVTSLMSGWRALVVALVAHATVTFGRTTIGGVRDAALAGASAVVFWLGASPFLIVAGSGLLGMVLFKAQTPMPRADSGREVRRSSFGTAALFLGVAGGMTALLYVFDRSLALLGMIMMKVDLFAFGGGYASVPLLYREIVNVHRWLPSHVFMDGIALGQITPGPIVITATFVGYRIAGIAGALVGTVGIFLPSLAMLVLAEPWYRQFRSSPLFGRITRGLFLSFVGLLASVTLRFGQALSWTLPLGLMASVCFAALLRRIHVAWVVLAAAAASVLFRF